MELTGRYPVDVRFIEMMPIGYGKQFKTINHKELLEEMHREYRGLLRTIRSTVMDRLCITGYQAPLEALGS